MARPVCCNVSMYKTVCCANVSYVLAERTNNVWQLSICNICWYLLDEMFVCLSGQRSQTFGDKQTCLLCCTAMLWEVNMDKTSAAITELYWNGHADKHSGRNMGEWGPWDSKFKTLKLYLVYIDLPRLLRVSTLFLRVTKHFSVSKT